MSRVSIIVPVYGVESYLPECVESLLGQTYRNLEVILVDDGSPDHCGQLCDAYGARDSRVKVIHKPNGGAASARNAGLDAATGDYICFVDSDDAVAPDYVETLLRHLEQEKADIAVCGFSLYAKSGKHPCQELEPAGIYTGREYLEQFLKNWTCALLWNKMYRKRTIGSLRMEEGHRIDDEFFTYRVVLNAGKIVVSGESVYDYRLRRSSVMQDTAAHAGAMLLDRIEYMQQRYENIRDRAPDLAEAFFLDLVDCYARFWRTCGRYPEAEQKLRSWIRGNVRTILQSSMGWKQKLIYLNALYLKPAGQELSGDQMEAEPRDLFD